MEMDVEHKGTKREKKKRATETEWAVEIGVRQKRSKKKAKTIKQREGRQRGQESSGENGLEHKLKKRDNESY